MSKKPTHIDRQKAIETRAFIPIAELLNIPFQEIDFTQESPDIRFDYNGLKIGVEIIECHPKSFNKKTKFAIDKLYKELEFELNKKGFYGSFHICLTDNVHSAKSIKAIKTQVFNETIGLINCTLKREDCKFVDEICKSSINTNNDTFIHPYEKFMHIIGNPYISDINDCISKKNELWSTYDKSLDEIWLLIYVPTNENYYSSYGISTLSGINTNYKRIYISDYLLRGRLIFEQP